MDQDMRERKLVKRSNPMGRSKEIKKVLDDLTEKGFGKSKTECEEQNICVFCHKQVDMENFRDKISKKEYGISGLCQKCQDDTFGV